MNRITQAMVIRTITDLITLHIQITGITTQAMRIMGILITVEVDLVL